MEASVCQAGGWPRSLCPKSAKWSFQRKCPAVGLSYQHLNLLFLWLHLTLSCRADFHP